MANAIEVDPSVISIEITIPEPSVADLRADSVRVKRYPDKKRNVFSCIYHLSSAGYNVSPIA